MADYPLASMLYVRELHEEQAKRTLKAVEERLQNARKTLEEQETELARYTVWRKEEENRRYAAMFGKCFTRDKLQTLREEIAQLIQGEVERAELVQKAKDAVTNEEANVMQARKTVLMARKNCMKLEEHRNLWREAMRKEEERVSDLEMEESRQPAPESDES